MFNPGNHILITGSHRSGTTWVGRTIAQQSKIEYIHEPFNVDYPDPRAGLKLNTWFTDYQSSEEKEKIRVAFDRLIKTDSIFYPINLCKPIDWNLKSLFGFSKHLVVSTLFRPRILLKDPIALLSAGWLHETYNLQVVCMIRKPLAFVGSLKKAGWDFNFTNLKKQKMLMQRCFAPFAEEVDKLCEYRGNFIERACLLWNVLHYRIAEYQKQYPAWLFVRYENIAVDPTREFEKIFRYLGLAMDQKIRKYIAMYTSGKNAPETQVTTYGPRNSRGSLKTWKTRLTPEECYRIENATRDIAALFYSD
jgi:hypothetical protein